MKTIKKMLVLFVTMMFTVVSFASIDNDSPSKEAFNAKVQLTQEDAVILRCVNEKYSNLKVLFYDNEGELLHERVICEKCNFKLTYSIKDLPHNTYIIKIVSDKEVVYKQKFAKKYGKFFLLK